MLSGEMPFGDITSDITVVQSVIDGKRPIRPSDERSRKRGLTDTVWELVETCWAQDPAGRPTAKQVVSQLQRLPNRSMDQRPLDGITVPTSSQVAMTTNCHNPFSALLPHHTDNCDVQELKWITR